MTYFVMAKHWDEKLQRATYYVAGQFERYYNAVLFRDAYNEHYSQHAIIKSTEELMETEMRKE